MQPGQSSAKKRINLPGRKYLNGIFLLLLLADVGYSFLQHYRMPLDGDMSAIICPSDGYGMVLSDPFGWGVISRGETYAAPNRFFAHGFMQTWFRNVPLCLQGFLSPIDSVYAACALAKTGFQVLLIYLLALYISGSGKIWKNEFILAAVLITPLFQAAGYNQVMGMIDKSITLNFFYALPMGLLLVYLLPFYRASYLGEKQKPGWILQVLLSMLAVVLAFNGPLIPGVVLIIALLVMLPPRRDQFGNSLLFSLRFFGFLCIYSIYIGRFNIENLTHEIPMLERYLRLPEGLFHQFTRKPGTWLLLLVIALNILLIRWKNAGPEGQKIIRALKWLGIFSLIFILLLPLGGYREYRPNIIRRDTLMPVFLGLFYIYGISSLFLIRRLQGLSKKIYLAGLVAFLALFTISDNFRFNNNDCERKALEEVARSPDPVVPLDADCNVMSWVRPTYPAATEWNACMLEYWGVTSEKKLYFTR